MSARRIASRIDNLGTETAFAVSGDAAAWMAKGNRVFPFHLGDMNIRTPLNIIEAANRAAVDGHTGYNPAAGIPALRDALAEAVSRDRGQNYSAANVSVQSGGKPVIGKFLNTVMEQGDGVLYPNPGYPIYESQVEYLGGRTQPYTYVVEDGRFRFDRESVVAALDDTTRVLIVNAQHNPTGADADPSDMEWLAGLAVERDLWVLSDDPYIDIRYDGTSHTILEHDGMAERTVILYTFSKKYAMTGWRLGAAIGPESVVDVITKINTNDESCTNHFVQYAGVEALQGDQSGSANILETLRGRRELIVDRLNGIDGVSVPESAATFYLFVDVTDVYKRMGLDPDSEDDVQKFRVSTMHETGVSFCSRSHFGRGTAGEPRVYVRFAYSGIDVADAEEGLAQLKAYWER
ncbi:MAG: aspartate aminotransferase [Gammaproteobacteria bacterium]|nr:aspartate aminotransferase [Gammaproteobacteria bacterium]